MKVEFQITRTLWRSINRGFYRACEYGYKKAVQSLFVGHQGLQIAGTEPWGVYGRNSWEILKTHWAPDVDGYPLCYGQSWKVFKQDSDTFTTVFGISVYGVGENRKSRWPEGREVERWAFSLWPGRRSERKEKPSKGKSRTFSDSLGGKTEEERTKPTAKSRPLSDKQSLIKPGVSQKRGCRRNIKWEPLEWKYLRNFELAFINK